VARMQTLPLPIVLFVLFCTFDCTFKTFAEIPKNLRFSYF